MSVGLISLRLPDSRVGRVGSWGLPGSRVGPVALASPGVGRASAATPGPDSVRVLEPIGGAALAPAGDAHAALRGAEVTGVAVESTTEGAFAARAVAGIAARRQITEQATAWLAERPYRLVDHRAVIRSPALRADWGEGEFREWRASASVCQAIRGARRPCA